MDIDPAQGPFLRKDGLAAGLTKHAVDGPGFHRLFGSVRVSVALALTTQVLARSASLVVPEAVISHHSAARLWGGIVPDDPLVHLTVLSAGDRRTRDGLRCHVRRSMRTTKVGDLRVTTPVQTFIDLACHLSLVDLVVLGDSLVRAGRLTSSELLQQVTSWGSPVPRRAQEAGELVRDGVESPMETRLRLLLILAGFAEPVIQHWLGDGAISYRLDLAYPELRVAFEYDGRHHAESHQQWGHDIGRREWLDGHGWRIVVIRADDIYATPWATVERVARILAAHGYTKVLPARAPASFARHFPGQPWRRSD